MSTPQNLVELIRSGRWRFGLATTYTFSLGFLETAVRPAWREHGSSALWVLSDVKGYRASLAEGETSGAGRDYHLLPVEVRGGVFHPKIVYLGGDERDVLLVSSANMTFAGQCRNLEVAAVAVSDRDPQAFADLLGFLQVWRDSNSIVCPDLTWMNLLERRLRRLPHLPISGGARLLYSPGEALEATLPRLVGTSARKVTVLSPFHDENGTAVERIVDALGSQEYAVGLDPSDASRSPFPFKAHPGAEPVLPFLDGSTRPLHAKIIEIEQENERWHVTGSFNATVTAILTTNNVEAALVRRVGIGEIAFQWVPAPTPEWAAAEAHEPNPSVSPSIYATLDLGGELRGRILGSSGLSGTWTGNLRFGSGSEYPLSVIVSEDGRFRTQLPPSETAASAHSSARLFLEQGHAVAEGWIHWPQILARDPITRATVIANLIEQGLPSDDDLLELLALIGESWKVRIHTPAKRETTASTGNPEDCAIEAPLQPELLAANESIPEPHLTTALTRAGDPRLLLRPLDELLRHLRQAQKKVPKPVPPSKGGEDDQDEEDAEEAERQLQRNLAIAEALNAFEREMQTVLKSQRQGRPSVPSWALAQWFPIGIAARAWRGESTRSCADFAGRWLESSRLCARQSDDTEYVTATLSAAIALAVAMDKPKRWTLSAIHDALLDALGTELSVEALTSYLPKDGDPLVRRISGNAETNSAAVLNEIISTPAKRIVLRELSDFLVTSKVAERGQKSLQRSAKQAILSAYKGKSLPRTGEILLPGLVEAWRTGRKFTPQAPLDVLCANSPTARSVFDDLVADRLPSEIVGIDATRPKPACINCSTGLLPTAVQEIKAWGITRCTGRCSAVIFDAR